MRLISEFVSEDSCPFHCKKLTFDFFLKYMIYRSRPAPGSTIARKFSKSYHKTLISAFMHIFRTTQFDSPPAFNKKVAQFMVGTKHTVVKEMQERGVTCKEGKYRMGFPIFKRLCKLMAAPGSAENLYARFWLTLE